MINGQNVFNQLIKNKFRIYDSMRKISTGQGDNYATSYPLYHNYFNKYYKMIAIDLSKQKALGSDPKAIQQINFTGNLARQGNENTAMFFIIEEAKETTIKEL